MIVIVVVVVVVIIIIIIIIIITVILTTQVRANDEHTTLSLDDLCERLTRELRPSLLPDELMQ